MTADGEQDALLLELRSAYPDVEWRPLVTAKNQIGAASAIVHGCEIRVYRKHRARPSSGKHTVLVYGVDPYSEDRQLLGSSGVGATAVLAVQNGLMDASRATRRDLKAAENRAATAAKTAADCAKLLATFRVLDQETKDKETDDNG